MVNCCGYIAVVAAAVTGGRTNSSFYVCRLRRRQLPQRVASYYFRLIPRTGRKNNSRRAAQAQPPDDIAH